MKPVVRWAGGKRLLANTIVSFFPSRYSRLVEPFVGGGSIFMSVVPDHLVINDYNNELINLYLCIKNDPQKLIKSLETLKNKYQQATSKESVYYAIRDEERNSNYKKKSCYYKAARMVFLNKTNFNGLYRVNGSGYYDVPWGHKAITPSIYEKDNIFEISQYFNKHNVLITHGDYKELLNVVKTGDFVYLDPPYDKLKNDTFTNYTKYGFNSLEQIKLKEFCDQLNKKGIKFLQSNNSTDRIRELYKEYNIIEIEAPRSISSKGDGRKKITEVLIKNY